MRALEERDAAVVADLAAELVALEEPEPFPPAFLGRLAKLMGTGAATYCELDRAHQTVLSMAAWFEGEEHSGDPDDDISPFWRLIAQHPVCGYRGRTGDWTSTQMVSDFTTLREFQRTEIWNELYRYEGVNHWIDVGLPSTGTHTRMFIFVQERSDFDERDRLVLDLLQPHLRRRAERVRLATTAAAALVSLAEEEDDPRHVVLCSPDGMIEFASSRARRLLRDHLQCTNGRLPDGVLQRLRRSGSVTAEREGRRLTLRAAPASGLLVLLLGEVDLRLELLTRRQRAILDHVARGDTDVEIARTLGIAPATVGKHLEQIFERLGVHTRTAAAAVVK